MRILKDAIRIKEIIADAEKGNADSQAYLAIAYLEGKCRYYFETNQKSQHYLL